MPICFANLRMNSPRVSIITPNFNKGDFVAECIDSVRAQTMPDWELIFVDDGSTDGSDNHAVRASKEDSRIKVLRNPARSKGAASARNIGLKASGAEYVLFLDSDDLIDPMCLDTRLKLMDAKPELGYIVFPTGIFFEKLGDSPLICNVPTQTPDLERFLDRDIVWLISGPIWRREVLKDLGGFDPQLHSQQDYDLHVRALISGVPYEYIHEPPQVFYRQVVDSLPRKLSQTVEHLHARYQMILRHCRMMEEAERVTPGVKTLFARHLLDLAQMMRWHRVELGARNALRAALGFWGETLELGLVDRSEFRLGRRYLHFKHNMLYNRFPGWQKKIEKRYREKLGELKFYPSRMYCKVTMDDYWRG